jgi:phosphopantetheinyl transferase
MAAQVFVFENVKDKDERHKLLQSALRDYSGIDSAEIIYKSKGKPSIKGTTKELYLSVAAVNEVMVCVFSEKPVGISGEYIQRFKDESANADYLSMAERFFTSEEADYCRENDAMNFVNVWTRKVAYCKYMGINMREFHTFSVTDGDKLYAKVKGVPLKKFSPQFPGSSEYVFIVAGDADI